MAYNFDGSIMIGAETRTDTDTFQATDPAKDETLPVQFSQAGKDDVDRACVLAQKAFEDFANLSPASRGNFLETIADEIEAIGGVLIETAMSETGLPQARLEGERGRTTGQLRLFAREVREGRWLDVTIDPAMPDRAPAPRADLRRMNVAVGPVAVFGASNFPLAFSVAGGDTASALAAGCPVVVKGHPAHPGTGELVARAIARAVAKHDLPHGVFSYLPGTTHDLGEALVRDPRIKAVGFTGSRKGGLALVKIAQQRDEPIPVYAEMSSINPVILLPHALKAKAAELGQAFVGSLMMGAGQFCTNPGLVFAVEGDGLDAFVDAAKDALGAVEPPVMLTSGIYQAFGEGVARLDGKDGVAKVACTKEGGTNRCAGALFETSARQFLDDKDLSAEIFGGASILVRCRDLAELRDVLGTLEGQLTATFHAAEADTDAARQILPILKDRAGRVLANGWPTGVEVSHAMVHGGPFPATSDVGTTSVGTLAMMRFLRPVCYQDVAEALLPEPLRTANPWGVARRVDGEWETA